MASQAPSSAKVALVTGGARGIGRSVAWTFVQAGMDLAFTYNGSSDAAARLVAEVEARGCHAHAIRADLGEPDAIEEIVRQLVQRFGRLDVLVNNASIFAPSPLARVTVADFDRNMAINARAPLMLIRALAPLLAARHRPDRPDSAGRIINFVDIHVLGEPLKGYTAYNASKAALLEITLSAAVELAPAVTVNAIAPGTVSWSAYHSEAERSSFLARVPLARQGTAEECAAAVLFLARDAHYCTGQVIRIDGGRLLT